MAQATVAAVKAPRLATMGAVDGRRRLAFLLMVASGFAALGYQIVWTQQSALWLGHEAAAVLAVIAAFFGGLALGSLLLGPRIDRSPHPGRWYAGCEATMGLWSLALAFLMAPVTAWLLDIIGPQPTQAWHWSVAFIGTFLLLLPATAAMGATLPAMERALGEIGGKGSSLAALYAGNTFGAVIGVLATAFWLVPGYGLTMTAILCAGLNLLCATVAIRIFENLRRHTPPPIQGEATRTLAILAATGLLGIGYEVLVVRVLSQVAENTIYTFALLLAVYLVGTSLGAAAYGRWLQATAKPVQLQNGLLRLLAASCLLGMLSLAAAQSIKAGVMDISGPGFANALAAETVLAMAAFLLPTFIMGALFSHLGTQAREAGVDFGRVLGINTLGAALAPFLIGVILVTTIGPKFALLAVAAGYLALSSGKAWRTSSQWALVAALLAMAIGLPSLAIIDVPPGGRVLQYTEGPLATVSVVEDANGIATLHINNRQQEGSSATLYSDARQALLPILLHPSPHKALFLGLGTGVTSSVAAQDPTLQVDVVELLPEVIEASRRFTDGMDAGHSNPRLHVMAGDARRFVRVGKEHYDVIISDNFHPARSGSGTLYTVEHFRAVHDRLAPGGLFCQWLPLHQLDLVTLRSIVRSFLAAYPGGWALLATNSLETPVLGLVAQKDGTRLDITQIRQRLAHAAFPFKTTEFGLDDDLALLGNFVAGPKALSRFADNAPLNTDDHPVVVYQAPRITYAPDSLPRDRLFAFLGAVEITPDEVLSSLLSSPLENAWASRLSAYWRARDRFIQVGRNVQPTSDVGQMLAQVRAPLLSVLSLSPDFRPALDPLMRMAMALGHTDPVAARGLLNELMTVEAERPETMEAIQQLINPSVQANHTDAHIQ